MLYTRLVLISILVSVIVAPVLAGLSQNEVLVVYNNSSPGPGHTEDYDWTISKRVADYYCDSEQRDIPSENELGINWPYPSYNLTPQEFIDRIQTPLKNYLDSRPHIKAIVLCYGVPYEISGGDRYASVDSALTLLFNTTAWGNEPMGTWGTTPYGSGVANPYYSQRFGSSYLLPLDRPMPSSFGDFRDSSYNSMTQSAPALNIVRMLDNDHAIAGGDKGILCRGAKSGGVWTWTPVSDVAKQFIGYRVTDISAVSGLCTFVCTSWAV